MSSDHSWVIQKLEQQLGTAAGTSAQAFCDKHPEIAQEYMVGIEKALFAADHDQSSQSLSPPWSEKQTSKLLDALTQMPAESLPKATSASTSLSELQRWIRSHPNDADKVIACIQLVPPEGIAIESALSDVGKQKRVFYATWRFSDGPSRPIVLKWVSDPSERNADTTEDVADVLERELIAHPLSNIHPNIIGTHLLKNRKSESFLVEKRIDVLSNRWRADGIDECANLLYGIAMALSYIHAHELVHGDIKPDNIGIDENQYVLLDFGICRREERFKQDEPTGSLRMRAPELLSGTSKNNKKSDIWALGATILNASSAGQFPLYKDSSPTPSDRTERIKVSKRLAERAEKEWEELVSNELARSVNEPLRSVLNLVLAKNPKDRPNATELVQLCESELAAYIRIQENNSVFSRSREAEMVIRHISRNIDALRLMPRSQKRVIRDILRGGEFSSADEHFVKALREILKQVDKS